MFRSIRWTLLFWYAVIIIASLAALGWALLAELERRLYEGADRQLAFWLSTARREVERTPEGGTPPLGDALPREATFAYWDASGTRRIGSDDDTASTPPTDTTPETREHVRVHAARTADGGWVQVGINVEDEHHRVRDFLMVILAASAVIVVVALGGGWLLVTRALAPVDRIATTAAEISGDDAGRRIDPGDVKNELADLAEILNASFDRLEDAIERQRRFTADASHELRTPLAVILSHLELAASKEHSPEELDARLATIHESACRMRSVVEGLLTLARADAGHTEFSSTMVQLVPLLESVRTDLATLADERRVTIEVSGRCRDVPGDPTHLREAFTNLYANAIHHGGDGGRVTVRADDEDDHVVVSVADTGPGIPERDLPHVFDRFHQGDESRSGGGSGLGLAITRAAVERHGGTVEAANGPTGGAVFTVRLPAHPSHVELSVLPRR